MWNCEGEIFVIRGILTKVNLLKFCRRGATLVRQCLEGTGVWGIQLDTESRPIQKAEMFVDSVDFLMKFHSQRSTQISLQGSQAIWWSFSQTSRSPEKQKINWSCRETHWHSWISHWGYSSYCHSPSNCWHPTVITLPHAGDKGTPSTYQLGKWNKVRILLASLRCVSCHKTDS